MSLLLLLDEEPGGVITPPAGGVLKVNIGTAAVPVWRKVGCGGVAGSTGRLKLHDGTQWWREVCDDDGDAPAFATTDYPTTAQGVRIFSDGTTMWALAYQLPGTVPTYLEAVYPTLNTYFSYASGDVTTGQSLWVKHSLSTVPAGTSISNIFKRNAGFGFLGGAIPDPGTVQAAPSAAPTRPLKVNVGTPEAPSWVIAACMVPA